MENFIHTFNLKDITICDKLIDIFNDKKNDRFKHAGTIATAVNHKPHIGKEVKDSMDLMISATNQQNPIINLYLNELGVGLSEYYEKFGGYMADVEIKRDWNIQYYKPGGGFYKWHSEKSSPEKDDISLVFMTYLNDVPKGGTEFLYQKVELEAKKGLSVIWPAEFTHVHKGVISMTHEKYIATGWLSTTHLKREE